MACVPVIRFFVCTQGKIHTVCAVAAQSRRISQQRQWKTIHNPSTVHPQGIHTLIHMDSPGSPQAVHTCRVSPARAIRVTERVFGHPQPLGTSPSTSGDNHGDNPADLWTARDTFKTIHNGPKLSTGSAHSPSTPPRLPGPAQTALVHTIHNAYYYCCL